MNWKNCSAKNEANQLGVHRAGFSLRNTTATAFPAVGTAADRSLLFLPLPQSHKWRSEQWAVRRFWMVSQRVAISNGTVIKPGWSSPLFYKEVEEKPFWCGEKRTGRNKAAKGHFSPVVLGGIVVNFQFLISITDQLQFLKHCCISQHHVQQQKGPCEPPQSMFACKSDIQPLGLSEGSSQS